MCLHALTRIAPVAIIVLVIWAAGGGGVDASATLRSVPVEAPLEAAQPADALGPGGLQLGTATSSETGPLLDPVGDSGFGASALWERLRDQLWDDSASRILFVTLAALVVAGLAVFVRPLFRVVRWLAPKTGRVCWVVVRSVALALFRVSRRGAREAARALRSAAPAGARRVTDGARAAVRQAERGRASIAAAAGRRGARRRARPPAPAVAPLPRSSGEAARSAAGPLVSPEIARGVDATAVLPAPSAPAPLPAVDDVVPVESFGVQHPDAPRLRRSALRFASRAIGVPAGSDANLLAAQLLEALDRGEGQVRYAVVMSRDDGTIDSVEAHVTLDIGGELLAPGVALDRAEGHRDLSQALFRLAAGQGFETLRACRTLRPALKLGLPVNPTLFADEALPEILAETARAHGAKPSSAVLMVPSAGVRAELAAAEEMMRQLRRYSVSAIFDATSAIRHGQFATLGFHAVRVELGETVYSSKAIGELSELAELASLSGLPLIGAGAQSPAGRELLDQLGCSHETGVELLSASELLRRLAAEQGVVGEGRWSSARWSRNRPRSSANRRCCRPAPHPTAPGRDRRARS